MSINIHTKNDVKYISVTEELDSKSKISYLLGEINYCNHKLHITFFDASILPVDIIEALYNLIKFNNCKVYVFKRFLFSYLISLGIKCRYVENKSLETKSMDIKPKSLGISCNKLDNDSVKNFLKDISDCYGYDYTDYQIESVKRRIKICMLREHITDFNDFRGVILNNEDIFEQLFIDLSINTTEFFRDPEVFSSIRNSVLPYLNTYAHIRVWCVGCSSGKEPYSLAILLKELNMLDKAHVYATDINPYVIEEAKNGLFPSNTLESDILNYRKSGGQESFTDYCEVKSQYIKMNDELKKKILFFQHSVVGSGILNEFQLILCRNVLIYFNPSLQQLVLENFYNSLDMSGFLVLGKSEGILQNGGLHFFNKYRSEDKIYRRKERW